MTRAFSIYIFMCLSSVTRVSYKALKLFRQMVENDRQRQPLEQVRRLFKAPQSIPKTRPCPAGTSLS